MVQAVENLTRIQGKVLARKPHPRLGEYDIVTLHVEQAEPVEGKANLLGDRTGRPLELAVRRALLGSATTNARLRCRAKMTPDGAICEPHPDEKDFDVKP